MYIFSEIDLPSRDIIEGIRKEYNHTYMSHSFSTLFLWKETLKLKLYAEEDFFVVKYELLDNNTYFFPCGNEQRARKFIEDLIAGNAQFAFIYMRKEDKDWLEREFPKQFECISDRGSFEYVYDRKEHIERQGGKYQKLRHEINHLIANNSVRTEIINVENISLISKLIDDWKFIHEEKVKEERKCTPGTEQYDDICVADNVLKFYMQLGFIGVIAYLDEIPQCIVAAAPISEDTYCIQIGKSRLQIAGMMPYTLLKCFEILPDTVIWVNGDDDMNHPGIRIHKEKMQPNRMNEVWIAKRVI